VTAINGPSARPWPAILRALSVVFALVPCALTVYFGFRSGGFFPDVSAAALLLLLLLLAGRVLIVPRPMEGLNGTLALATGALALFALWTMLSSQWSHAPGRAFVEFDRALLYVTALVVFGAGGMDPQRLRWMVRGIALAAVVVCGSGLVIRLLPDVWPVAYGSISARLSYPITYWNAFALLAATGITICFGLTSSEREPRLVRVLAAAAIPALASALLLTLSRGGIATAVLGVLLFAVVGHPRALLSAVLAVGPVTAIAVSSTYGAADLLVSTDFLGDAARAQGHHVATVVAACAVTAGSLRGVLLYADDIVARLRLTATMRRRVLGLAAVAVVAAAVAGAVAVDVPRQYDAFVSSAAAGPVKQDDKTRITAFTNNGRLAHWNVAIDEFERQMLRGTGAGTFENSWRMHRKTPVQVLDAHSLYAEVLGELGIVGLVLLLTALLTILVGVGRRTRGTDRALYATIFAAITTWAFAAGFDWHWEMPVVTTWVFALGGAALASARDPMPATRYLRMAPRSAIALGLCALLAFVPLRLIVSQERLKSAVLAYGNADCSDVSVLAGQSLGAVSSRPEPHELLAACELHEGRGKAALASMQAAIQRDPDSWRPHYSLAVIQARVGRDPRLEMRRALRLNPQSALVRQTAAGLGAARGVDQWRRVARKMRLQVQTPKL